MMISRVNKLISMGDLTGAEIRDVLDKSFALIDQQNRKKLADEFKDRRVLLIFDEPSFRTRSAFELAAFDLGATAHVYSGGEARLSSKNNYCEHMPDLGAMVNGFYDAVVVRIYDNNILTNFAKHVSIPLINGMCDLNHPTQALCDVFTIMRLKGVIQNLKIAFIGDFTNVARSLAQLLAALGCRLHVSCPSSIFDTQCDVKNLVIYSENPTLAANRADVIITDVWIPMNSTRTDEELQAFAPYQVNESLCAHASPDFIFMHNLPANRGNEVTSAVIDSPHSVVYEEGVSRLHIARGLLAWLMS